MALETDDNLSVLLVGTFRSVDDLVEALCVNANRLLHENVFVLLDGVVKVNRAESWRSRDTDEVDLIDHCLVRIKSCILSAGWNIELLFFALAFELLADHREPFSTRSGSVDLILKRIGNSDELRAVVCREVLHDSSGVSASDANHSDLDLIASCDLCGNFDWECGCSSPCGSGTSHKIAAADFRFFI